jgi:uncharacterized protein (TIGR03083 family)
VNDLDQAAATDALTAVYQQVTDVASGLGDTDLMRPSRCAGWAVADVLYHQLLDARRALRAFATPSQGPPDTNDVTYWEQYAPRGPDASGSAESAAHARHVRVVASAYPPGALAWEWGETSSAACRAARACPHEAISTQGLTLRTADFIATLTVEAAVHYLDLTVGLPVAPAPDPAPLALVRRALDGLLGIPAPLPWDDSTYAFKGTGRLPFTGEERSALGALADRFPLFN